MTQQRQRQQYYIILSGYHAFYSPLSKDQLQGIEETGRVKLGRDAPAYTCSGHPAFLADLAQRGPSSFSYLCTAPVTRLYVVDAVMEVTPKAQAAFAKAIKECRKEEQ